MKRDYPYALFLEKCSRIYENKPAEIEITPVVRIKKTKEQNAEEVRIRKQKSREKQSAEKGDEECRKKMAKEAADRRRKKREANP